jgi:N-methylhydantoinase A
VTTLAVDIGGTFTDVALDCVAGRFTRKVLTTREAPELGFMAGVDAVLAAAKLSIAQVSLVVHGTTLLTNALIERKGARVAFLTTAGHRDTLEIGTESRFHLYDLNIDKPQPLVPRELRFTVPERLDAAGEVLESLDEAAVTAFAHRLASLRIDSLAIGFLHSYANPRHEQRAAELVRAVLPDLDITLSAAISPEMREYDRFTTACANAYVKPIAARYLGRLDAMLAARGFAGSLLLMHSGGGMITLDTAREQPIRLLESGPAGGAIFAASIARELDLPAAIGFDMGGTTAKLCLIENATPRTGRAFELDRVYRFMKGSGLPIRIPVIEMVEIGAGGGSIASVDRMGRLRVGPESAGAAPGPACYGRGGARATVTDADLVLGRLDADRFADGAVQLSSAAASTAIERELAAPLGVSIERAAQGVCDLVNEHMASAARMHLQEHALDPARQVVIAFGGAGPLHAGALATRLGVRRIVVPAQAGVGSAIGFLQAPVAFEVVRSLPMHWSAFRRDAVERLLAQAFTETAAVVARAAPNLAIKQSVTAFMRYVGQGHELEVPIDPDRLTMLSEAFEQHYAARYGRTLPGVDVAISSWRVSAMATIPRMNHRPATIEPTITRGPATLAWPDTTIYIPAGFTARTVAGGHLLIERDS